jgi:hypothetical protein
MRQRGTLAALLFIFSLAGGAAAPRQAAKPDQPRGASEVPPLSWTCPMHPEILEDKKASCPICKMDLVPIRLDSVWTCATRPLAVIQTGPGRCPIDGTALVQVTAAISWSCPGGAEESVSPGTCPDGSPMQKKYASRAHGNHNPQHGGLFFMASDNTHHLEGTYLPSGVFRMYFYDEFTKPQKLADMKNIKATVIVKDSRAGKDATYSLVRSGRYLQATIGKLPLPAEMYAKVKFALDGKDNRFDFTFPAYSKEPHAIPTATMTNAAPAAAPAGPPGASTTSASPGIPSGSDVPSGIDAALVPLPIPDTVPEMLAQLRARTDQIRQFIDRGSFASIYVPAFQAKDLALALEAHKNELPAARRKLAEPAFSKLVRSAWLLDAFGDIGNKQQISEAYTKFVEAANNIQSAFPQP